MQYQFQAQSGGLID